MADFWVYLEAVISNWLSSFWVLTALPEAASYIVPSESAQRAFAYFDQWISPKTRQRFYRILFAVGLFVAGFVAWDEQYRIAINKSPENLTELKNQVEQFRKRMWEPLDSSAVRAAASELRAAVGSSHTFAIEYDCTDNCLDVAESIFKIAQIAGWKGGEPRRQEYASQYGRGIIVSPEGRREDAAASALLSVLTKRHLPARKEYLAAGSTDNPLVYIDVSDKPLPSEEK